MTAVGAVEVDADLFLRLGDVRMEHSPTDAFLDAERPALEPSSA
jgi:hypothetical protein